MSGHVQISAGNRDLKKLLGNPKITFVLGKQQHNLELSLI